MEGSVQPSQTAGVSNPKPAPGPKPRLAPKPFSLQTNTTIRSIHAPKSIVDASKTATPQGVKSEDATVPKPAVPAPPLKPTTSVRAPTKEQGEPTKAAEAGQAGRDASDGKSDPVPQTTPAVEKPKTAPLESDNAIENNRKTSADAATKLEREDESKKDGTSSTESQVLDESGNPAHRWGSTRKRLSMEITSRFEQGGGPPPAPSNIGKQATSAKHDIIRAECTNPEQNQTTSELPEREGEESGPKEDYVGGGSIKRRISLLFDSRPEVPVKREEPEMINGTGGVKARIKNWAMDTVPEKKPQFVPRPRSKSTETSTPAEKTPETPPTEPPTSSSQVADLPSTSLPVHQPTEGEVSGKHKETEATEDGQSPIFSQAADHTDETDSANNALKRDNSKRRSVHFGVVEKDDGGPPVILGPESDSSEEEEEGQEKEDAEADVPVSVPVYRRVGLFQKDGSAEAEEAEKLHHLEFEKKRRAEETEEARRTIEEHKRKEEEEGKEREKERQLEIERVRNEKRQRLEREQERVRLEEEEREKERLREEEIERKRMRLEEEEQEKERLRQEQLEKQRIALERMRLEEEEKERLRLEEMEKKRMELERMRLEEEEKERLRQEEMEKKRMGLERMRLEEEEKEKLRQEEMEKKRMELERMRLEEEEKERLRQEEMEKKRMELERMRLEQEEKERLRQEEMESRRKELERRLEEEEREKEKLRKEMERQRMELERRLEEEEREKEKLRKEMERQRMELERRLEEEENEKERMRREMERQMELDTIRMEEEERLKENEMERHREEWERARWEEEHREKENIKEEEIERERRIHQLWDRQKEEIEMMEDIPQEERESKRLWLERERQRLRKEEEERVIHESDEHKFESKLREEEINIEKQREEEWENHWVSKVERLKEENEEKNDPSLMWQSRKEEERDKYTRWKEEQGVERGQKEKEDILISFDSGGVPAKSSDSHRSPTQEPPEANVEVVYEDFSIKKNLLEVEFDDFSVKPVKSGGGARDEIVQDGGQGAAADAPSEEDEEVDVSMFKWEYKAKQQVESADTREPAASQDRGEEEEQLIFSTEITSPSTTQEEPKQEEDAHEVQDDTREERGRSHGDPGASETTRVSFWTMQYLGGKLSAAQLQVAGWVGNVRRSLQGALDLVWGSAEDKQEEEQDEGVDGGGRFQRAVSPLRNFARRSRRSLRRLSTRSRTTVHRKAGETRSAEDNSCTNVKEKGAEVLIDGVPDEQNEAPDQPSETDSPDPESDHHLEISSEDLDTTDFRSETDVAPFPESSTPLLDSSAQKSKADLSKRMSRTRPSRSLRAGLSQGESPDWRISDSSVLSSKQRESDSEDEQPKQKIFSPHPTSQRVPIFPGLSPAALIAQIKRKTGGKVEETLDDNGREEKEAGAAPSPSQLSSSPRTAAHLTGAARVLPPLPGTDEGATACPPWLKELKSKKRLSQYDGEP